MTDYYCASPANGGDDANDGLAGNPVATYTRLFALCNNSAPAGSTAHFNGGDEFLADGIRLDYHDIKWNTNLVNITSYGNGKATILADGAHAIEFKGQFNGDPQSKSGANISNLILKNINTSQGTSGIFYLSDLICGTVDNCEVIGFGIGIQSQTANDYAPHDLAITNTVIAHCGNAGFFGQCDKLIIDDCTFYNNGYKRANGLDHQMYISGGKTATLNWQVANDTYVRRNKFYNNCYIEGNKSTCIVTHGRLKNFVIEDNILISEIGTSWGGGYGIGVTPGYAETDEFCEGLIIRRNFIDGFGAKGIFVRSASDIEIYDNSMVCSGVLSGASTMMGVHVEKSGDDPESVNASITNNQVYFDNTVTQNVLAAVIDPEVQGVVVNQGNSLTRYDQPLRFMITESPLNGNVDSIDNLGNFTYTGENGGAGSDQLKYRITDPTKGAESNIATVSLTIAVGTPPTVNIDTQPVNQTVNEPTPAVFSIVASSTNGPITYQWKLNGVNVTDGSGSATDTYTTSATVEGQTGAYTCVVDDASNIPVTSNSANLTVNAPSTGLTLNLSGTDEYMTFTNVTFGIGDSITVTFNTSTITHNSKIFDSSTGARVQAILSRVNANFFVLSTVNVASATIDGNAIALGSDNIISYLDGVDHILVITPNNGATVNRLGASQTPSDWFTGALKALTLDNTNGGGGITTYNIDSGSTTTDPADVGTGTLTYINVVAGDWS